MVKQINWSPLAKGELRSLLLSSVQRFGNKEQGKIIYSLFQNALHRITLNPFIGQATEVDNIRYITPCPDYTLFYRHSLLKIEILVLWDNSHKVGKIKSIPIGNKKRRQNSFDIFSFDTSSYQKQPVIRYSLNSA